MNIEDLDLGDVVYAANNIVNDGSMPGSEENEILAQQGSRGVIVMKGYVEESPDRSVFLIRFEDKDLNLGPPIGCWGEDLIADISLN
jgi:nitrogen fixation protein NifZ